MAKDRATVKADGTVSVEDFRVIVDAMADLLSSLTAESTDNPAVVEWVIHGLRAGSATIVTRGVPGTHSATHTIEDVIGRYELLARKAHNGRIDDFPTAVQNAVRRLAGLVNDRITRISLSGGDGDGDWVIDPELGGEEDDDSADRVGVDLGRYARSSVRGRVVTLDDKHALYFTLEEAHTGRMIRCYPDQRFKRQLADYWKESAWIIVEGTYSRYTDPATIKAITDITPFDPAPAGGWRAAIGCAPRGPSAEAVSSAEMVRRVRDG